MANEPINTPVQTEYAEHLAAALAANQAEQAALTARLDKLQGEEKWLTAALTDTPRAATEPPPAPAQPARSTPPAGEGTDAAAVPLPRMEKPANGAAPTRKATTAARASDKKTTAKRTAEVPAKKTSAVKKTAAKKTAAAGAKETAQSQPTLAELLSAILSKLPGEPKKASEIQSELEAAHPDRATSVQTIRNALQRLVEKGRLERDNRQGMVLYTWPAPEATPPPSAEPKAEELTPAPV
ncbi:hypothetical protein [Streptomyces subrutilus]|uniref:hypothetical protein n=1 Tax=Streptomyces subrutilus TaxID=36818 RepID=UPI0034012C17